jgi:hypothetical protein
MQFLPLVARRCAGFGVMLSACLSAAFAAPPTAPVVDTSADVKLLNFDWDPVPGSNYYQLWFRANNGASWTRFMELPAATPHAYNNISVHLLDWDQARYQVKACNADGCGTSTLGVKTHMLESIGYFKGAASYTAGAFGSAAAISENGQYLASIAAHEPGGAGDPAVVYVFLRSNNQWQQQARIVPSPSTDTRKNRGLRAPREARLALSADGSRLLVAMPYRNNTGATGTRHYKSIGIYHRSGSTWTREYQEITPQYGDGTATSVAEMNEGGDRVVYWMPSGLEVLERTSSVWVKRDAVPPVAPAGGENYSCNAAYTRLSGDGNSLLQLCAPSIYEAANHVLIRKAPDWHLENDIQLEPPLDHVASRLATDYSGNNIAVSMTPVDMFREYDGQVQLFRIDNGAVTKHVMRPGAWFSGPFPQGFTYGWNIALSHDGAWLSVVDPHDRGVGTGVYSPPLQSGRELTGTVYVYDLRGSSPTLRRLLKPNVPGKTFDGVSLVAFGNNGKSLLLADPGDDSGARGIDGNRNDASKPESGALWLY